MPDLLDLLVAVRFFGITFDLELEEVDFGRTDLANWIDKPASFPAVSFFPDTLTLKMVFACANRFRSLNLDFDTPSTSAVLRAVANGALIRAFTSE